MWGAYTYLNNKIVGEMIIMKYAEITLTDTQINELRDKGYITIPMTPKATIRLFYDK